MMRLSLLVAVFCCINGLVFSAPLAISTEAEAVILMNADTGAILYEKNARESNYPASTTKIATALYTLKVQGHKLDREITAEQDCIGWVSEEAKKRSNYTLPAYWLEPGGNAHEY